MIARLRRRMTALVVAVLILVSCGIVFSINYMNWKNITTQAEAALETLGENSGARPQLKKRDEWESAGKELEESEVPGAREKKPGTSGVGSSRPAAGQPLDTEDALASLSNYYVVTLSSDDVVKSWSSDREDLYTDEQVRDMTALALASGKRSGRIGTQFYRVTSQSGKKLLIVLDERLDILNARSVLRTTALIASLACLLLCVAAYFLIRIMVRPVQEAFERQRRFVGDASHELKTPLAVIEANVDVLRDEIGENEQIDYIRSEVKRTDRLISDLLTLTRMDQGRMSVQRKEMDLGKAVLGVALPFESTAFEEGKQLILDVPEQISCMGDEAMLKQLVVILLGNAFKYTDTGGRIAVAVSAKGNSRELRVSNTGKGIAPEELDRIFDRFYRGDTSHNRKVEGYGLGLSIAKEIVDAHRGRIRVSSEENGETVFRVSLPGSSPR